MVCQQRCSDHTCLYGFGALVVKLVLLIHAVQAKWEVKIPNNRPLHQGGTPRYILINTDQVLWLASTVHVYRPSPRAAREAKRLTYST